MIYILLVQWPHLGILPLLSLTCFPLNIFSSKSASSLQEMAIFCCHRNVWHDRHAAPSCLLGSLYVLHPVSTFVWVHGFFTPLSAFQHIAGSVFKSGCESSVCKQYFTLFEKLRLLTTLSHMVKTLHMQWHHSFCLDPLENSEAAAAATMLFPCVILYSSKYLMLQLTPWLTKKGGPSGVGGPVRSLLLHMLIYSPACWLRKWLCIPHLEMDYVSYQYPVPSCFTY